MSFPLCSEMFPLEPHPPTCGRNLLSQACPCPLLFVFFFKISFDSPLNHRSHIKLGDLPVHLNGSHDSLFSYLLDPFSLLTFGCIPPLSLTSLVSCSTLFTPEFILHFHLIVFTCPPSMNSCSFTVYVPKACLILTL